MGEGRDRDDGVDLARVGAGWLRTLLRGDKLRGEGADTTAAERAGGSAGDAAEPQLLPAGYSGL
jgi:hypothetical protein